MQDAVIKGELKEGENSTPPKLFLMGSPHLSLLQDVKEP